VSSSAEEEIESLRRSLRKARSDLQAKEDDLREARG